MSAELATVTSLEDFRARHQERLDINLLLARLASLRGVIIEPPDELLPAIMAQLDEAGRPRWSRVPQTNRWVAAAGSLAAGAIVLAGRSAWSRLAS